MAFTISRTRVAAVMAKAETTANYGIDQAPTPATDDILTINSPNPTEAQVDMIEFRPHASTSFTRPLDIPAARDVRQRFTFLLAGSGAKGTTAINGFAAIDALLRSTGMKSTVSAGVSITYTPQAIASLESATVWTNLNGVAHKTAGCYGNITMTANPTTGIECNYDGVGIYLGGSATASLFSGWTGGTNRAQAFLNVAGTITPSGGSGYVGKVQSVTFNQGAEIQRLIDANDSTGIAGEVYTDRNPTLEVVLALDTDTGANLTYPNMYANMTAQTTHAVVFGVNGGTGNNIRFSFPTAQVKSVKLGEANGYRTVALMYKVQHSTADTEYSITIT